MRLTARVLLTLALVSPALACKPSAPQHQGGGEGGGGGGGSGGGGGGGGGGKNRKAREAEEAKAKAAATSTRTSTSAALVDEAPFVVGGAGGLRGSQQGGGTGLGTGGGATAKLEGETEEHGKRRQRPAAVYVDGVPLAAVTYGELPSGLAATWVTFDNGNKVRRFSVPDYLRALGIDLTKVKAAHFHSGRKRVGILTGEQLRKSSDSVMFSFTQDTTGKTRMHFAPDSGITTAIDRLWTLALYVDKPAPTVHEVTHALMLDGKPLTDLAYVTTPVGGGARISLDGRLLGYVKRSSLAAKTSSTSGPVPFRLGEVLRAHGVDLATIKAVELIGDDKVVARPAAKSLATLDVQLAEHSGGYIKLPTGESANVVALYAKKPAPDWKKR